MSNFWFDVSCWCDWRVCYHLKSFHNKWWILPVRSALPCVQTINIDMSKSVFFSSAAMATVCLDNSPQMTIISAPSASQMEAVIMWLKQCSQKQKSCHISQLISCRSSTRSVRQVFISLSYPDTSAIVKCPARFYDYVLIIGQKRETKYLLKSTWNPDQSLFIFMMWMIAACF